MNIFTQDLLDFKTSAASYKYKYHDDLIDQIHVFKTRFLPLTEGTPQITFDYFYISKLDGIAAEIENNPVIRGAENKIRKTLQELLSPARPSFHYIDAAGLLAQVKKRPVDKKLLPFDKLLGIKEGFVGLVKLRDYYKFLAGDDRNINARLFESNVRGFQNSTDVNRGIRKTLDDKDATEFWLLNNGITILGSSIETKTLEILEVADPQIVNGLQTSREIFSYYKSAGPSSDDERRILIRVVKIADDTMREAIVYATNAQNPMERAALRSTDEIHGHIEELFQKVGLFYDRRPGHHKDQSRPIGSIVSIVGLLQAMVSVVLGKPHEAYGAPGRYLRNNELYSSVFGEYRFPLAVFLKAIEIQRKVDSLLLEPSLNLERGDRLRIRLYVSSYAIRAALKKAEPSANEIVEFDLVTLSKSLVQDCYNRVMTIYTGEGGNNIAAKSSRIFEKLRTQWRRRYARKKKPSVEAA